MSILKLLDTYEKKIMEKTDIKAKITQMAAKRDSLVELLERPSLGTLRIDVDQALEELDELIEEFNETFPEEKV
nr:hypothetical protein [Pleurocapsa sp. FMAR1]